MNVVNFITRIQIILLNLLFTYVITNNKRDLQLVNLEDNDFSMSKYLTNSNLPWYNRQPFALENKRVNFSVYTRSNSNNSYGYFMDQNQVYINIDSNNSQYSQLTANLTSITSQNKNSKIWVNFTIPQYYINTYTKTNYTSTLFNKTGWLNNIYSPPYDIECTFFSYDMYYNPRIVNKINLTNITNYKSLSIGIDQNNKLKLINLEIGDLNEINFFDKYNHQNFTMLKNLPFHSVKIKKNIILLQSFEKIFILNIYDPIPDFYSTSFNISFYANNFFILGSNNSFVYDFDIYGNIFFVATSNGLHYYTNNANFLTGPYLLQGTFQNVKFNKNYNQSIRFIPSKLFCTKDTLIALMAYQGIKIIDLSYIYNKGSFNSSYNYEDMIGVSEFYHPYVFTMDDYLNDYTGKSFIGLGIDQRGNDIPEFFIEILVEGWGEVRIFKVFNSGPNQIIFDNIRSDDWYTYILDKNSESVIIIKRGRMPDMPNSIFKLPLKFPYQKRDFNKTEVTKAYLIYDTNSGNYTVVYTNKNSSNMLQYIYEMDAGMDCYLNTPGIYEVKFEGKAEICDPLKFYDVQNYCSVNSIVTINALPKGYQEDDENMYDFKFRKKEEQNPALFIIIGCVIAVILFIVAFIIIFKYKCFIHLCKKTLHHRLDNQQYQKTGNDLDIQVDQK